ncbi:hypothetical protein N8I77_009298 [Diaporthe amygdali]|uniref:Uncharacterized protein n=1 Tax=Phomopsis amygdali TaxID=1214568 RepID=A0AAD9S9V8_PHOAM|nr:hypothetical protein N8I77_009298 [Diaporthe amygdali]
MSNTTSRFFSFSDEFKEWAKQEDAVNNQMNSNWIPAYIIITLIPIGFIISAALASRKETKRQASERAARAARIGPGPNDSRNSIASDTGAVIAGGATHGTDDVSPARRQLRGPVGEQFRQHEHRHAKSGPSSAQSRARGRSIWPSYLE